MKIFAIAVVALMTIAFGGCGQRHVDEEPVTQVNTPRPKTIVELTNEVGIPLTNVPKFTTATNK